jgi:hypothetical protein
MPAASQAQLRRPVLASRASFLSGDRRRHVIPSAGSLRHDQNHGLAPHDAICASLPLGSVAVEPYFNEKGERTVWLDEVWVDRL